MRPADQVTWLIIRSSYCINEINKMQDPVEVRYIRNHDEQQKISRSCHVDPTSGHLGIKKTERFMWPGASKDVELL